jgi:hypothetical protein
MRFSRLAPTAATASVEPAKAKPQAKPIHDHGKIHKLM